MELCEVLKGGYVCSLESKVNASTCKNQKKKKKKNPKKQKTPKQETLDKPANSN